MHSLETTIRFTCGTVGLPMVFCLLGPLAPAADDWNRFQNGGVVEVDPGAYPTKWTPVDGIAWQVALAGYGQSSPVVSQSQIYVTSVSGDMKNDLHVQAFALESGKLLWQFDAKNSSPEKNTTYVSRASPTPVCDASGVIASFEGGNIVSLDPTGTVRWQRDLVADYGPITARHGLASSLEQNADHVFVWIQREQDPYIVAISKASGETVWKSPALTVTSWSSPRLIPVDDGHHLVLSGIGQIAGLDPATGERLWDFDDIANNSTPTPMPIGSGKFLIGASDGRGESGGGNAAESNGVIAIKKSDDGKFSAEYAWRADKATCSFGSPIVHDGLAYFVNRAGAVYCLDADTGDEVYVKRSASSIWATPIVIGKNIYLFGKDGTTTVVRSGREFDVVSENALWTNPASQAGQAGGPMGFGGPVLYAAVAAQQRLLLRRGDRLYCIANEKSVGDQ